MELNTEWGLGIHPPLPPLRECFRTLLFQGGTVWWAPTSRSEWPAGRTKSSFPVCPARPPPFPTFRRCLPRRDAGSSSSIHHGAYAPRCVRLRGYGLRNGLEPACTVTRVNGCMRPTPLTSRSCRLMLAFPCRPAGCCTMARPYHLPCRGGVMCAAEARTVKRTRGSADARHARVELREEELERAWPTGGARHQLFFFRVNER